MSFQSKSIWKNKILYIVAAVALLVASVASFFVFSSDSPKPKPTSSSTTSSTTKPYIAPLTGLPDPTGESQNRPALAVKIGNNPEARPQAGIAEADIMYEEIVEGGITRYMGVYHSTVPERVGPVRSVRGMDPNIALNWGGVFAYSGGSSANESKIKNTRGIVALNETSAGSGMQRDRSRSAPNNLYALPSVLFEKEASPKPPVAQFSFSNKVPSVTTTVSSFVVGFKSGFACTWTYDAETGKFLRSYGTKPVVDQKGVQAAYENIIVQYINYPSESEGITTGSGRVQIFRDGKVVEGTWSRPSTSEPAEFTDADGNTILLKPGRTWVELVSTSIAVTVTP